MEKTKISVLGCCVSRELFNYSDKFNIVSTVYTSFISLFEDKMEISMEDCLNAIESNFQARNVWLECNKEVFNFLKGNKGEYLIIDFGETINGFYEVNVAKENEKNKTVRVAATQFTRKCLEKNSIPFKFVPSQDCNVQEIVRKLFENIFSIYPKENVYLNKTTLSRWYVDQEGNIQPFGNFYRLTEQQVSTVRAFEREARQYLPKENVLEPLPYAFSDGAHKYGLSPVHYCDDDYRFMAHRMERLFKRIENEALYNSYSSLYSNTKALLVRMLEETCL